MAIYHLTAKVISRGQGHSAVAAAAYRARTGLVDERTGDLHDYSRKSSELLFAGIYAPKDAPDWTKDRAQLWNHVEAFEKRRDAQLAREFEVALMSELTLEQNRFAIQDWVRENFTRKGLIADVAIHAPGKGGDTRNIHAHVLVVTRKLDGSEFAARKERTADNDERKADLDNLRESWERIGNRHLERQGHAPTLDRRTLLAQGSAKVATKHLGKDATAMERRGVETDLGDHNRTAHDIQIIDLAAAKLRREEQQRRALEDERRRADLEQQAKVLRDLQQQRKEEARQRRADQQQQGSAPKEAQIPSPAPAPDRKPDPAPEPELSKTAGEIRMAWSLTNSGQGFVNALEDRGLIVAQVTTKEVRASLERHDAAKVSHPDKMPPSKLREGELVVVNSFGSVYRLTPQTIGELRPIIEQHLAPVDRRPMPSVTDAQDVQREASRTTYRHEQTAIRDAKWEAIKASRAEKAAARAETAAERHAAQLHRELKSAEREIGRKVERAVDTPLMVAGKAAKAGDVVLTRLTDFADQVLDLFVGAPAPRPFSPGEYLANKEARESFHQEVRQSRAREAALDRMVDDRKAGRHLAADDVRRLDRNELENIKRYGDSYMNGLIDDHLRSRERRSWGRERER